MFAGFTQARLPQASDRRHKGSENGPTAAISFRTRASRPLHALRLMTYATRKCRADRNDDPNAYVESGLRTNLFGATIRAHGRRLPMKPAPLAILSLFCWLSLFTFGQ